MATTFSALAEEEKKKVNQIFNKQKEQINANANASIADAERSYDEQQRAIAVQKLINERKVAESMANLGLTDSGLNRTQQTAIQLSAANAGYNLNRQKQEAIDEIKLQRDNDISTVEQNRLASDIDIDNNYASMETSALNAQLKANEESKYIIKSNKALLPADHDGTLKSKGVSHYIVKIDGAKYDRYVDSNTGHILELPYGTNPYSGTVNKDIENGAYENGYQPNNVNGAKLRQAYFPNGKEAKYEINGYKYRIHTANGKFYIWNRGDNKYDEYTKEELKKKGVELL